MQPLSETSFIRDLRRRFVTPRGRSGAVRLGIGDDCALLAPRPGYEVAVTTDLFLESRHFRRDTHAPESSGHRCLARGLSDLASMGAAPLAAFLSLALPAESVASTAGRRWLDRFLHGLHALALTHNVPLAGGDTGEAPGPHLIADIVLLGELPRGSALTRSRGRPGDLLYVSGALGGSAAQLRSMLAQPTGRPRSQRGGPQTYPEPRLALGEALRRRQGITACLDVSDGLSTDLAHLCSESGVAAVVDVASLPLHPLAQKQPDALSLALHGGEDYELLFTASPRSRLPHSLGGVPIHRIGELVPAIATTAQVTLRHGDNTSEPLAPGGWEHLHSARTR